MKNKKMSKKGSVDPKIQSLLEDHNLGIKLDIGCGANKQHGFVGIDIRPEPGVDIVHNLEETPWPLPEGCASLATASHVLEHINPHNFVFVNVMNEIWRILKPGGRFAFVVPYAGSVGYWQDPTHCNGITEATLAYFDPMDQSKLYYIYKPKPWKIVDVAWSINGNLEAVLEKRLIDKSYGCEK